MKCDRSVMILRMFPTVILLNLEDFFNKEINVHLV